MSKTLWSLPFWAHGFILKVTGYRLVRIHNYPEKPVYLWSKEWPLPPGATNQV